VKAKLINRQLYFLHTQYILKIRAKETVNWMITDQRPGAVILEKLSHSVEFMQPKIHCCFRKTELGHNLRQINPVHSLCSLMIHFNIINPSKRVVSHVVSSPWVLQVKFWLHLSSKCRYIPAHFE
jgi:hypothetical protein